MKCLLFVLCFFVIERSNAQTYGMMRSTENPSNQSTDWNIPFTPTNLTGNHFVMASMSGDMYYWTMTRKYMFLAQNNAANAGAPTSIAWFKSDSGELVRSPLSAFSLPYTQVSGAPAQVNLIAGSGIQLSGSYPNITVSVIPRTITNNVSRPLSPAGVGGSFTISSTQYADVLYPLVLSVATPLLAGTASASAFLEYSLNAGSTWETLPPISNSQSVGLSVSVAINMPQGMIVGGAIPPSALVRIRTVVSGTGSPAVTFGNNSVGGQECLTNF